MQSLLGGRVCPGSLQDLLSLEQGGKGLGKLEEVAKKIWLKWKSEELSIIICKSHLPLHLQGFDPC